MKFNGDAPARWLDTSEIDEAKMSDKNPMFDCPTADKFNRDEAWRALAESQIGGSQDSIKPAKDRQEGGNHYKDMVIQPYEYCQKNNLGYCESNVIKYVSRWKNKDGIKDLKKARHMLDLLIEEVGE